MLARASLACYQSLIDLFASASEYDDCDVVRTVAFAGLCDLVVCHLHDVSESFVYESIVSTVLDTNPARTEYGIVCLGRILLSDCVESEFAEDIILSLGKIWLAAPHHTHGEGRFLQVCSCMEHCKRPARCSEDNVAYPAGDNRSGTRELHLP